MFTGLIEKVGKIDRIDKKGNYLILSIQSDLDHSDIKLGESIACDGACLTVVKVSDKAFDVEVSQETIAKTIISTYRENDQINLERALRMGDRLGGHMVSGHIDTVGTISSVKNIGNSIEVEVIYDPQFDPLVIEKGSIAINGISLTVNRVGKSILSVNIIPHTADMTTIKIFKANQKVNLEFDMIGKYIQKMNKSEDNTLTIEKLKKSGW